MPLERPKTEKIWYTETFIDEFGRRIDRMKSMPFVKDGGNYEHLTEGVKAEIRYIGSAVFGQMMIQFEIKTNSLREAFEKYDEYGEARVAEIKQKMTSGIVIPGQDAVNSILRAPRASEPPSGPQPRYNPR